MIKKLRPNDVCVLFRADQGTLDEMTEAQKYFTVYQYRSHIPWCTYVIPRYSALPYYKELCVDLSKNVNIPLNSYEQHKYIVNADWINDLTEDTPKTWDDTNFYTAPSDIHYVVKGKINSRKNQFRSMMFATSKRDALNIAANLKCDSLIGQQDIIYREYIPLKTLQNIDLDVPPVVNEWRVFILGNKVIAKGFYWGTADDDVIQSAQWSPKADALLEKCISIIGQKTNFYVLDLAEKVDGEWIVIEMNDGSQSGLSCIPPAEFYSNLAQLIYE